MSTESLTRHGPRIAGREAAIASAYALGALLLACEAAIHVQQFVTIFHQVKWIGPLFVANAVALVATITGLAYQRTRELAALVGVVISTLALGSLVVSYGHGLFGWHESGFRTPIAIALISEVGAVILLTAALAVTNGRSHSR